MWDFPPVETTKAEVLRESTYVRTLKQTANKSVPYRRVPLTTATSPGSRGVGRNGTLACCRFFAEYFCAWCDVLRRLLRLAGALFPVMSWEVI